MNPILELAMRLQAWGPLGPAVLLVVKATIVLLVARLLLLALPKASAATKHLAVTSALCAVIALPILSMAIPAWRLPLLPSVEQKQERGVAGIGSTGDDQEPATTLETAVSVAKAAGLVAEEKLTRASALVRTIRDSWQGLFVLAVAAVSAALLLRMLIGVIGVWSVMRRSEEITDGDSLRELDAARDYVGLRRSVRLLRSSSISVPVVWGLFQPVLLLPASAREWTRERLRVVLLHELAHVKRCDGLTLLITKAAVAIFWFHPLAWSLETLSRAECERACDDLVLASGTRASDYAEHLLQIARALPEADPFRSVTLAMTRRSQLEGRLLSILHPHISRSTFSARAVSIVSTVALLLIVPLAAVRIVAAPNGAEKVPDGVVEIGPTYAGKFERTPELMLAQAERLKSRTIDRWTTTPDSGRGWYKRGMDLYRAKQYPEAIAAFRKAIEADHAVEGATYNIACVYSLMGDRANALRELRSAIDKGFDVEHAMADSDLDAIRNTGEFAQIMGERGREIAESAVREFEQLKTEPSADNGDWLEAANDLLHVRQLDAAVEAYNRAIAGSKHNSTAMYNLACAYSLKGDAGNALEWLHRAIVNGFSNSERFENDADLNNIRKLPRFAELEVLSDDLALKKSPENGVEWIAGLFADDSWQEALGHFEETTRKYPQLGRTWFNLGYAQLQANKPAEAVNSFRRAADLDYRVATSLYNAACGLARSGQTDAAFQYLEKARAAGFDLREYLTEDDDLESLRTDPRFDQLRKDVRADKRSNKHKFEFDFKKML